VTSKLDPLLDEAPCGFFAVADDGRVVAANATLGRMLGTPTEALRGKHVDSLFAPASRIFYQTHVFPMLKLEARVHEIYVSLRDSEGGEVPVLLNGARIQRHGSPVNDFIAVPMRRRNEYETQILAARKAAEDATRAKDDFLAVVSHELRTPLNSISRAIQAIVRNARLQTKLIDDILDFARITSGKLRLEIAPVDLLRVVESAMDGLAPAAAAKSIHMEKVIEPGLGLVSGDADRLQQVMWNLLTNAVKFTPEGGRVEVRLAHSRTSAEITVTDTGRGIPPSFLPYVFDRFRQADDSGVRKEGGLGLGMSITRHLVELHGGSVGAASEGEGKGAMFTVRLPLAGPVAPG
jgi:PAS domain S-box-containing protein